MNICSTFVYIRYHEYAKPLKLSSITSFVRTESVGFESSCADARQPRVDCQDERGEKVLEEKSRQVLLST